MVGGSIFDTSAFNGELADVCVAVKGARAKKLSMSEAKAQASFYKEEKGWRFPALEDALLSHGSVHLLGFLLGPHYVDRVLQAKKWFEAGEMNSSADVPDGGFYLFETADHYTALVCSGC